MGAYRIEYSEIEYHSPGGLGSVATTARDTATVSGERLAEMLLGGAYVVWSAVRLTDIG